MPASIVMRTKMAGEEFAPARAILRFVPSIAPPGVPPSTHSLRSVLLEDNKVKVYGSSSIVCQAQALRAASQMAKSYDTYPAHLLNSTTSGLDDRVGSTIDDRDSRAASGFSDRRLFLLQQDEVIEEGEWETDDEEEEDVEGYKSESSDDDDEIEDEVLGSENDD
ncbi:hypothetical protein RHMOL_Rhmol07G0295900 [Rhododendron molle]|uniref:Uncharacterized protein n=1 Tax=Rhododendron molle TaxID=49168 RepID=A0ACC0N6L4_RHOML|nr:hypothetical protein RHMOL_Rhmol07G0295900 [Rhododendron molle]